MSTPNTPPSLSSDSSDFKKSNHSPSSNVSQISKNAYNLPNFSCIINQQEILHDSENPTKMNERYAIDQENSALDNIIEEKNKKSNKEQEQEIANEFDNGIILVDKVPNKRILGLFFGYFPKITFAIFFRSILISRFFEAVTMIGIFYNNVFIIFLNFVY